MESTPLEKLRGDAGFNSLTYGVLKDPFHFPRNFGAFYSYMYMIEQEILNKINELKVDQYMIFPDIPWPMAILRSSEDGKLYEYHNIFSAPKFNPKRSELGDSSVTPEMRGSYIIVDGPEEFRKALKHYILEREVRDLVSGKLESVNFPLIHKEVDTNFGRELLEKPGTYLAGATVSDEDYYYLYWTPGISGAKAFEYDTCVSPPKKFNTSGTLDKSLYDRLRKDIDLYVYDAMFPCAALAEETKD